MGRFSGVDCCLFAPASASASLVYQSSVTASAQGFGNAPRDLTLQATGNAVSESGGVGLGPGGSIIFGTSVPDGPEGSAVFMGNGVINLSTTAAMPAPLADDQKYGVPTIGSLGITSARQIGVLFNATEPGGDSVNVLDLTLKFYTSAGSFLGAIDGQQNFATSFAGNGVAGFTFVVDPAQQAFVDGLLSIGGSSTTMALEASIRDFAGGPESFLIYNLDANAIPVPEPAAFGLMLTSLVIMGSVLRIGRPGQSRHQS